MKSLIKNIYIITILVIFILTIATLVTNAETIDIAKIGDKTYSSLYEAIENSKEGDVVEILNDSAESQAIKITKAI